LITGPSGPTEPSDQTERESLFSFSQSKERELIGNDIPTGVHGVAGRLITKLDFVSERTIKEDHHHYPREEKDWRRVLRATPQHVIQALFLIKEEEVARWLRFSIVFRVESVRGVKALWFRVSFRYFSLGLRVSVAS